MWLQTKRLIPLCLVQSTFGRISAVFDLELGHTSKWQCVDQDLQDLFVEGLVTSLTQGNLATFGFQRITGVGHGTLFIEALLLDLIRPLC